MIPLSSQTWSPARGVDRDCLIADALVVFVSSTFVPNVVTLLSCMRVPIDESLSINSDMYSSVGRSIGMEIIYRAFVRFELSFSADFVNGVLTTCWFPGLVLCWAIDVYWWQWSSLACSPSSSCVTAGSVLDIHPVASMEGVSSVSEICLARVDKFCTYLWRHLWALTRQVIRS